MSLRRIERINAHHTVALCPRDECPPRWAASPAVRRAVAVGLAMACTFGMRAAAGQALTPDAQAVVSAPTGAPTSQLHRLALGELGGWVAVDVELDGITSRWLLDTGASRHFVAPALAQRLGLRAGARRRAQMPLGQLDGHEVELPALRVGTIERAGQTAIVAELDKVFGPAATGLDGVLGAPLLETVGLLLDLRTGVATWLPVDTPACQAGLVPVPLRRHRGLPVVTVQTEGGEQTLVLDTGNPAGVIRVATTGLPPAAGLSVAPGQQLSVMPRASLGPHERTDVPQLWLVAPALATELARGSIHGLLGMAWLEGARWQLDLAQDRLCVEAARHVTPGGFGLTLQRKGESVVAGTVLPGSPADRAGLRAGDTIWRWAGLPASSSVASLWQAVQGLARVELEAGQPPRVLHLDRAIFAPRATAP